MRCRHLAHSWLVSILLLLVGACVPWEQAATIPQAASGMGQQENMVPLEVDLAGAAQRSEVRKVRFATLRPGERRSVQQGQDLLRVGRYDEEVLTLPKVRASRDFRIELQDGRASRIFYGYSNVTYESLRADHWFRAVLFEDLLGFVELSGRLGETFYQSTNVHGRYRVVQGKVSPPGVRFQRVRRTRVLPETEKQYVLRYLGKEGMQLVFELRHLCGGSRPRILRRERMTVPLGPPELEVAGHVWRVHTATPEILDVTLVR